MRIYRRKGRLKVFLAYHLFEIPLSLVVAALAGFLTTVAFLASFRGQGLGLAGVLLVPIFVLAVFPFFFLGLHLLALYLLRRRLPFGLGVQEAWRLCLVSLLILAPSVRILSVANTALKRTLFLSPDSPKLVQGSSLPLYSLGKFSCGFLPEDILRRYTILSIQGDPSSALRVTWRQWKDRGFFCLLPAFPEGKEAPKRLRVETQEEIPPLGTRPGPVFLFPLEPPRPLDISLVKAHWREGSSPALILSLRTDLPLSEVRVCFRFGENLSLRLAQEGPPRDLLFQAQLLGVRNWKGREYACYGPFFPDSGPGTFSLEFPLVQEDFQELKRRGTRDFGKGPVPAEILLEVQPDSGIFPGLRPLEKHLSFPLSLP
ncbi:hypothetical protein FVE67_04380 [Thermosulfurimonas marina]|uniref:Uncharacterized protein n=1 Tax=Thermosulfurimonas marina TaxID=2047767 RepID=A0A6H1WSC9_9BACT|nr:hypothetical protein FVE67_04380 [Thermosulfurimonas marina]